ncbi:Cthe_2314 family HEPN domain-containing protein [Neptunomonas phycophila]|uniref:Cthe_2314 family HEPN domain-containing protein n=1 Tax=Neptunomonas phycophila TaxID=1572645 RepID=A0ABT9EXQ6_9GAMM|nr:Cthe_2314 family HEPN domain-containing protein [Neptunomonas phycophila]MDP2523834.1 Cthe_2314 family HEPN domain-containing protein [Neptunomonas phycophila]
MHSEHPKIKQFFPLVTASLSRGVKALSNGEKSYEASAIEKYAQDVFSRISEIDNSFKNLSITVEYLKQKTYENSKYNFSEHHSFHIENFLLRLTSVVDRSYLLAGSTMLMENHKIEKIGGNRKVNQKLSDFSPASAEILKKMESEIDHLRTHRNKVAHQAGFSSKNLCVLQTIENAESECISVREITDIMTYDQIKDVVIEESINQYESVLPVMDSLVKELIESLSFVYDGLLEMHITSKSR